MAVDEAARKRRYLAKLDEILDELDTVRAQVQVLKNAAEGANPVKDVLTCFDEQWMRRYRTDEHYKFTDSDAGNVKRFLKTMDVNTVRLRVERYLRDSDTWIVSQRHPFNVFVKRINNYAPDALRPPNMQALAYDPAPPADCPHDPTCLDDVACTSKKRAEFHQ
jgi:hypothetical protein